MIKHIWFDSTDTLVKADKQVIDDLQYTSFARLTHREVTQEVIDEYDALFIKHVGSRGAVFNAIGAPQGYWAGQVATLSAEKVYSLINPSIPVILQKLQSFISISLFSNVKADDILEVLGIEKTLFTHIITGDMLVEPKPALEGFYKMIAMSNVPPQEILYIGDNIGKDILPAKEVGLKTGLVWGKSTEADYTFEKFEDILKIFE
jgi:FMN phosphatase YigB (HAD superfamily)